MNHYRNYISSYHLEIGPGTGYFLENENIRKANSIEKITLVEIDKEMINLCRNFNIPFLPVLTKSDKFSNNNIARAKSYIKKQLPESDPVAVSSKDIIGFDKLSRKILNFIK